MNKEKIIVGLDLGANSIGWAIIKANEIIETDENGKEHTTLKPIGIIKAGSRIIPTDADMLGNFQKGISISQTAVRTQARMARRMRERFLLRRNRLHAVLNILGFLPNHFANEIDFGRHYGQFTHPTDAKLAYRRVNGKDDFLFNNSFDEMCHEFAEINGDLAGKKIPHDWTIYYLRKKALTQPISKEELAWIILNFNQKRGYYQLRGEEEEDDINTKSEFVALKILDIVPTGEKKNGKEWFEFKLDNGEVYRCQSASAPMALIGTTKEFIRTAKATKTGEKISYRAPKEDDWKLKKLKAESMLSESGKTVGEYIYDSLLHNPLQRIKGGLIQTIERKFYIDEIKKIIEKQKNFIPELTDATLLEKCVDRLYPSNTEHANMLKSHDAAYLINTDILFYQRPLRSQKGLIDECPYETRSYMKDGEIKSHGVKCAPKSHPLFEEFRLWQFLHDVRLIDCDTNQDVTSQHIKCDKDYEQLFAELHKCSEIDSSKFIKLAGYKRRKGVKEDEIKWNYGDNARPMCPTFYSILKALNGKTDIDAMEFLNIETADGCKPKAGQSAPSTLSNAVRLWHILYSVSTREESEKAFHSFANRFGEHITDKEGFVKDMLKIKPFKSDYASYSLKAIKKLTPLMAMGDLWDFDKIDANTQQRIEKIINNHEEIPADIRAKFVKDNISCLDAYSFQGLPLWAACYAVYGRHSEAANTDTLRTPDDINQYLYEFRLHSLRNPIVEQVVTETMRVIRDIMQEVGKIDEFHIELARELKNTADDRKRLNDLNTKNEATNKRLRLLLLELTGSMSLSDLDKLKLYEEGALKGNEVSDEIAKIAQKADPTPKEIEIYKLWLDQKYCSPYTGQPISLAKLFDKQKRYYDIDHIIPQALYYDDSLSNKVICEREANKEKGKSMPKQFFTEKGGKTIDLGDGSKVRILNWEEYSSLVNARFKNLPVKRTKLLLEEIPEKFIERQMNDTKYISRMMLALLSRIVRDDDEQGAVSKHVIPVTGKITTKLKEDWGMIDVWNSIIEPRFHRLEGMLPDECFGTYENGKFKPQLPAKFGKLEKKRIDHRHHAMDAIVIACASRSIVNFLNNDNAQTSHYQMRQNWRAKLCDKNNNKWLFHKPWKSFTQDAHSALDNIVVSFKQNLRVLTLTHNHYMKYDSNGKKTKHEQVGTNWAIRKPLHKETYYGRINLRLSRKANNVKEVVSNYKRLSNEELKAFIAEMIEKHRFTIDSVTEYFKERKNIFKGASIENEEFYYYSDEEKPLCTSREPISPKFNIEKIDTIIDPCIREILKKQLKENNNDPDKAFSPEGILNLNSDIKRLNNGHDHKPINKVKTTLALGLKFQVGQIGHKKDAFVIAQSGTNLFYAVFKTKKKNEREATTIPLREVIDSYKSGDFKLADYSLNGQKPLFFLSPGDLVYVPTIDQLDQIISIEDVIANKDRIYKFVKSTSNRSYYIPSHIAKVIIDKGEFDKNNILEKLDNFTIKNICIKLKVNRLGDIELA